MTQKEKFKSEGFSLVLTTLSGKKIVVNIPKTKTTTLNKSAGGMQTYQMAIDAYTVNFNSKNELLDDIRKHDYADINTISNDDIRVSMTYGESVLDVVYSDQKKLKQLISGSPVTSRFNTDDQGYAAKITADFMDQAARLYYKSEFREYYREYLRQRPFYAYDSILKSLNTGYDEGRYKRDGKLRVNWGFPFYEYGNIRDYLLTDYRKLESKFALRRFKESPFNEMSEAERDYYETLDEINKRYGSYEKVENTGATFENFEEPLVSSGPYTVDPEEEMERLNNPTSQDLIDTELEYKRKRADEICNILETAGYPTNRNDLEGYLEKHQSNLEYNRYISELEGLYEDIDSLRPSSDYERQYVEYYESQIPEYEQVPYEELGEFNYYSENKKR